MQLFNKGAIKRIFSHTWYIYPLLSGLIAVIWLWAFAAFHQPTKHETLTLFFSTELKSDKYLNGLMKHYSKEKLREVEDHYALPDSSGYYQKLKTYLVNSDLLILDKHTLDEFAGYQDRFFHDITDEIKDEYITSEHDYYTYTDEEENTYTYGVKIKDKGVEHYLSTYMTFDELSDYYVVISTSSVNVGTLRGNSNKAYDNALTFMNYLLEL